MKTHPFRLASNEALSDNERGWITILRAICPEGVPRPTLRATQTLREGLDDQRRTEAMARWRN